MAEEKTRIDFNAPTSLVEQVDAVAELLDTSRTRILVDALRNELDDLVHEEEVRRLIADAFYASEITFETVESVLGTEEALRMKLLRDSIDREPPEPVLEDRPPAEDFYDGFLPEWTPGEESDDDTASLALE